MMTNPVFQQLLTGTGFSLALVAFSYTAHHLLFPQRIPIDVRRLALFASGVFTLAILFEAMVNPLYEDQFGHKLWEYRILPVHDANVSALAPIIWTAYGVHLYFLLNRLDQLTWVRRNPILIKALVIGVEAPFFFEVIGNLFFLFFSEQYYAYYLPADIFHLTSLQVIPVYACSMLCGLALYAVLERLSPGWRSSLLIYLGGVVFVAMG